MEMDPAANRLLEAPNTTIAQPCEQVITTPSGVQRLEAPQPIVDNGKLDEHGRLLLDQSRLLNENSRILNEHSRLLNKHSRLLNKHSRLLIKHGRTLNGRIHLIEKQLATSMQSQVATPQHQNFVPLSWPLAPTIAPHAAGFSTAYNFVPLTAGFGARVCAVPLTTCYGAGYSFLPLAAGFSTAPTLSPLGGGFSTAHTLAPLATSFGTAPSFMPLATSLNTAPTLAPLAASFNAAHTPAPITSLNFTANFRAGPVALSGITSSDATYNAILPPSKHQKLNAPEASMIALPSDSNDVKDSSDVGESASGQSK
ncbi:hypothetical protein GGI17_000721 [Coemansia sp. S146]|nr:hypothetical protein GGI17_000721 [Coemansia sp. S146]